MATTRSYQRHQRVMAQENYETNHRARLNQIAADEAYAAATEASARLYDLFTTGRSAEAWAELASLTRPQLVCAAIDMAVYLEAMGTAAAWGDILTRWETRLGELAALAAVAAAAAQELVAMQAKVAAAETAATEVSFDAFLVVTRACTTALTPLADVYFAHRTAHAEAARQDERPYFAQLIAQEAELAGLLALAETGYLDDPDPASGLVKVARLLTVASRTTPGKTYRVAADGSSCTCTGYAFRGRCVHATAQAKAYATAVAYDPGAGFEACRNDGEPGLWVSWGTAA